MNKYILIFFLQIFIVSCGAQSKYAGDDDCDKFNSRSSKCIDLVFERNKEKLNSIYESELRSKQILQGNVVFNIHLDSNGKVNKIFVIENELESKVLAEKMANIIKGFQFYHGVEYSFNYPIDMLEQ